jgi:hypothetical protein
MTSSNVNLAGPNAIFLNIILAVIAFILIIYLRNMYVTIIAVVIVVGVYLVFDTKALFKINDNPATPYIDSQPLEASISNSASGSVLNEPVVPVVQELTEVEAEIEKSSGCSDIDLNDPNVVKIYSYEDFATNSSNATTPGKIFVLMNDIDCVGAVIEGTVYNTFNASFEGNCFSIKNFTISNTTTGTNVGFFGKVEATDNSPIYIKNVTFMDFNFSITQQPDGQINTIGIFAQVTSTASSPSENDITFEHITVHLNKPSLITIQSTTNSYYNVGALIGKGAYAKLSDCNVIVSHTFDLYIYSTNYKSLSFGMISGYLDNSSIMACSVNMIGSELILHTSTDNIHFGLLCGRTWSSTNTTLNLLNNILILKDASLKTDYVISKYGYLLGSKAGVQTVTAKNNNVLLFVNDSFFGGRDKLGGSKLTVYKNNKMIDLASTNPSDVSLTDQIYGMKLYNTNDSVSEVYWKKVYYVYYEGDTSSMGCRYYDVFNFWKNTELGTYCVDENKCNTNMYGACDSGQGRRGWEQLSGFVEIDCQNTGSTTYTLTENISLTTYEPILLEDGITFDGNGKTITYNGSDNWKGLFGFVKKDYKLNVNIKNVTLQLSGSIANGQGGILGTSVFGWDDGGDFANYDITIQDCHVKGGSLTAWSGGIVGQGCSSNSESSCFIIRCSNSCAISGKYSGGICAPNCGKYGKLEVISCWNTGDLSSGTDNGGIMGINTSSNGSNSYVFVFNCYNQGNLGSSSGGICATSNHSGDKLIMLNCYSYCQISDLNNDTGSWGGIVSSNNQNFKPYVIYCDVYLTNSATYTNSTDISKFVSRNGYRDIGIGEDNLTLNTIVSISDLENSKYHTLNYNITSLKNLIETLSYEFISPTWNTDNLTIPENLN